MLSDDGLLRRWWLADAGGVDVVTFHRVSASSRSRTITGLLVSFTAENRDRDVIVCHDCLTAIIMSYSLSVFLKRCKMWIYKKI